MEREIRVRFAPSPTGPLHIGGVRTALYNYLFARKNKGSFILRIEDTDKLRYVPGAEEYIFHSLEWLGIHYDEGPGKGGKYQPYRQSERMEIYHQYAEKLVRDGFAYYAFDTAEELEALRQKLKMEHSDFQKYDFISRKQMKNSLTLSPAEVEKRIHSAEHYVVRLKVPEDREILVPDKIRGAVKFNSSQLDDKVLYKSDGMPTYHLANVVDDHLMQISHVIRGEEWLPSAPVHVLLYEYLGWKESMPEFAHLPLILKPDGNGKLSKRDGDRLGFPVFPLQWTDPETGEISPGYKESGYLPEAVVNIVAMLGWNPGGENEIFSMDELAEIFSLDRVVHAGAKFNPQKAQWYNQHYLKSAENDRLAGLVLPGLEERGIQADPGYVSKVFGLVKEKISYLKEFCDYSLYFFRDPEQYDESIIRKKWNPENESFFRNLQAELSKLVNFTAPEVERIFGEIAGLSGQKPGYFMQVFRVILSGSGSGPHLFDVAALLGSEKVGQRITLALNKFKIN